MAESKLEVARRLERLGARLADHRLSRNITQHQLAKQSGISHSTIRRLEGGENVSLEALVSVLDALGLGDRLDAMVPSLDVRPVERVKLKGAERRRATSRDETPTASDWAWGDES